MKIKSLKLRGFIGIKAGLGLDEISIDLSNLSGLIALAGPNGKGKTTILDNLHPYRTLPSRNKAMKHHVFLRDSYRDFVFEFEGDEYRTLIKIDAESERSEGFIWKNGVSEVDGKVSNYDDYINHLLGSQSLFFNSVFCAQGSKKLADMTAGDLKALFSEFLKLDTLIGYEKTAHQCSGILTQKNTKMENEIANLKAQVSCVEDLEESIINASKKVKAEEEHLTALNDDLAKAEADIEKYWKAASANDVLRHRQKDIEASIKTIMDDLRSDSWQFETNKLAIEKGINIARTEKVKAEEIFANEAAILEAVRTCDELADRIKATTLAINANRTESSSLEQKLREYETDLFTLRAKEKELIADPTAKILKQEIKALHDKTADLEKKDVECTSTACSFIVGALEAQQQLPGLQDRLALLLKEIDKDLDNVRLLIKKQEGNIAVFDSLKTAKQKEYASLQTKLKTDQSEFDRLLILAKQKSELDVANEKLKTAEKREAELADDLAKGTEAFKNKEATNMSRIKGLEEQIQILAKDIDDNIGQKVKAEEARIRQLKSEIAATSKTITELQGEISRLERTKEETLRKKQEISTMEESRKAVLQGLSEWQYLKAACSKDGLRALEIDSVAPMISGYANSLLATTFAPAYSLQFKTLDEESGREILDILVNRESGSVLLENLSGGEKVWCLKALRLAMTLVAKEKSGKQSLSCFADEEDGALDAGNAENFIHLYRAFMDSGKFEACYFISHRQECIALSDYLLAFNDGITIQ